MTQIQLRRLRQWEMEAEIGGRYAKGRVGRCFSMGGQE